MKKHGNKGNRGFKNPDVLSKNRSKVAEIVHLRHEGSNDDIAKLPVVDQLLVEALVKATCAPNWDDATITDYIIRYGDERAAEALRNHKSSQS